MAKQSIDRVGVVLEQVWCMNRTVLGQSWAGRDMRLGRVGSRLDRVGIELGHGRTGLQQSSDRVDRVGSKHGQDWTGLG